MDTHTLSKARRKKNDEFYTQLHYIEEELQFYREHFCGKVVYLNCDDYRHSQFVKYFTDNFHSLGLRKLIATSYGHSELAQQHLTDLSRFGETYKFTKTNKNTKITHMIDDGDFRSAECIEILKSADIVVTNPPFSLFREFLARMFEYDKKFVLIGGVSALSYIDVFALLQQGKMWLGHTQLNRNMLFDVPESRIVELLQEPEGSKYKVVDGVVKGRAAALWVTNLYNKREYAEVPMTNEYSPDEYPVYDNYAAINVNKMSAIPKDYDGLMGVPVTYFVKHNPDQFEIVDMLRAPTIDGRKLFRRIIIRAL